MFRIATWNVNSLKVRLPQVLDFLHAHQPTVLALQETKTVDEQFPVDAITHAGYHVEYAGQKTYNGVALLSKRKPTDVCKVLPGFEDPQQRFLAATYDDIRVLNLYVPNGASVDSDKYQYKLAWLAALTAHVKKQFSSHSKWILLGDFNIAPEDRDVYDPAAWEGQVLFSEPEKAAFRTLLGCGLVDTFRLFPQPEQSYTWWDYRQGRFRRNHGLRIDHILTNQSLAKECTRSYIDPMPRKHEQPSDHTPVIAEFNE